MYVEDGGCDSHEITLTHELGNSPILGQFPVDEAISSTAFEAGGFDCPGFNDPLLPDFIITITNLTDIEWVDLFFVADAGITIGNKDGSIKSGDAFKIDTVGINTPLLSESIDADLVFDPGEDWTFFVLDWGCRAPSRRRSRRSGSVRIRWASRRRGRASSPTRFPSRPRPS